MANRIVKTGRELLRAICFVCGKEWSSRNAHGVAVQHHDKTGHTVAISYEMTYVYGYSDPAVGLGDQRALIPTGEGQ